MKKRLFSILMVLVLMLSMVITGCSSSSSSDSSDSSSDDSSSDDGTYEIALVTDVGNIDDKSFNQGAWEGVEQYAEDNGVSYAYYRPTEDSTQARVETMTTAIEKGAKVIVCPGYLFEEAVYEMQSEYPDVQFLILDGEPHNEDYSDYLTTENTYCILYQEEQAGYFAGYAAVMDGYTQLGFLGGMEIPSVQRYGYGYLQGIDDAAAELGITDSVTVKYYYCGSFTASDDIQTKMSGWYADGTEIVFSCGGSIYTSACAAAEAAGTAVIGVDVDQSAESDTIVTSAMKGLTNSVVLALTALYDNGGTWPEGYAGTTATLGAADDCVGLPTAEDSWKLSNYKVEEYEALYESVVNGEIEISNNVDAAPEVSVTVDYQS